MAGRTITSIAIFPEDIPAPVFVGRENGTVEKYASADTACFGKPVVTLYGHSKAVTAIVAISSEEIQTCSMDGTIRQWSTETEQEELNRCRSVVKFSTPLRCLAMMEGRLYTGGDDGCLSVIDDSRRESWPGHKDTLTCIAFGREESSIVITGGHDNHIRVWDSSSAKTIRLFVGHHNHIKCLRVVSGDVLFSFSRDLTLKVWRLPEVGDEPGEDSPTSPLDPTRQATVSFKEPGNKGSGVFEDAAVPRDATTLGTNEKAEDGDDEAVAANAYHAAVEHGKDVKSAMKSKPEHPIRRQNALGTIEIPETPQMVTATDEEADFCYIGASNGYVLGINARALSRTVLRFIAHNNAKVRASIREVREILRNATRAIRRRCRRAVQKKQRELLRAAKKAKKAKRAAERKEKAEAAAALRAEKAAARAAAIEEGYSEEEEEEEEGESDGNGEIDDEENEEEEDEEEEDQEDPLAPLDEDQREEFKAFRLEEEKVRDAEIAALRSASEERKSIVDVVASATYNTTRDQFFRLSFTSYKHIGEETVLSLLVNKSTCCAAQADSIVPVDITPGLTYL